ncbi:uncharacterized protein LOC126910354 isoform X2 [Daktulosphaira vitifoliae]|uniref:uncharacterized protein LOC126910354 isoform X2 n=1 Tax=Daktulosphaira vitifoliae TaxID=58002 RepID=UPI0021A9C62B|nr:uncharacterized protein LOC126910354 isoform X2 [Daktulosphaira vitifoliae]
MADNVNTADPEANLLNINKAIKISDLVNNINNVKENKTQCNLLSPNNDTRNNITIDNKNHVTFYNNESNHICSKHFNDSYTSYTTTDSDESSSSSSTETLNRAPDGGWGWVVVFASFMVNLIADGVTFSFGVIFIEFEKYFDEGKSKTAWIGSLFMAVPLLSGPIASFLTDRYGCQKVTIIGSIIASTGFVLSAFADSLIVLFITFGFISGFGLSLCYVAAVVIVAYYFDKKRSFATGLSVCGSGIGTVIFAPVNHMLLSYFGWRGCTLILAGLFLNLCIFGMLMRDLPWTKEKLQNERKKKKHARLIKRRLKSTTSYDRHSQHTQLQTSPMSGSNEEVENTIPIDLENERGLPNITKDLRLCNSLVNLPTFIRNHENVPLEVLEALTQKKHLYSVLIQNYPSLLLPSRSFSDSGRLNDLGNLSPTQSLHLQKLLDLHTKLEEQSNKNPFVNNVDEKIESVPINNEYDVLKNNDDYIWWIKKDNQQVKRLQTAYLQDIKIHRHSLTYRGAMLNINRYRLRASSCPNIYRNSMTTIAKEKQEVLLGWAGDKAWVNANTVYAGSMVLCGIVIALVPLFKSYASLSILSALFGLFISANYSFTSIILVEIITLERFTNAYGVLLLVQGIANLIGPPLAGGIYDITQTYDLSFYLGGFFIAISGFLLCVYPLVKMISRRRRNQILSNHKNKINDIATPDCKKCSTLNNDILFIPKRHSISATNV